LLGAIRIIPYIGSAKLQLDLGQAIFLVGKVKDTP
jgi:hypothetical protein|tara:strand:+ start:1894 stop:1998 length:105 start_codon:yes stop_codon:yes gene_type:complete